jgi:uncharacterized membrane protein YqjE
MANNHEPADNFQQLYDDVKKYVELQTEYVKVEFVEKLTILLSTLLIIGIAMVLVIAALFYLFFTLAYALQPLFGSMALSFALITGIYLLLIVLFMIYRKRIVINPLVRFLSNLFLKNKEDL